MNKTDKFARLKKFFQVEDISLKYFGKITGFAAFFLLLFAGFFYAIFYLLTGHNPGEAANYSAIVLNILVAAVGFIAIFVSVQSDKDTKVYEFISDFNFHFLTSDEFIDVERKLESCYQEYKRIAGEDRELSTEEEVVFRQTCDHIFGTNNYEFSREKAGDKSSKFDETGCISKEYQSLINYLVYLESFAILIERKKIDISVIDNLFGYRYFLAMNNPVMQENEIFPEQDYYRGCINIYEKWERETKNAVPMKSFSMAKRMKEWEKKQKKKLKRDKNRIKRS